MSKSFQIDLRKLLAEMRRRFNSRVTGVEVNLPGLTFCLDPSDPEKKAAREIVIFLKDRRVLNSKECCDNCIDNSLASLLKIREFIVERQLQLGVLEFGASGPLYLLTEFTLEAVRQFLTYHEQLERESAGVEIESSVPDFRRPRDIRESYFEALNRLRSHLHQCVHQIRIIADIELPEVPENLKDGWQADIYVTE